ncbi:MAG: hypothetical protein M3361_20975 [Candidatus Tectomicrobia bacterium]|nr:hypothetical protein [Candidatus Tectomicrobia bacterium]
MKPTLTVAAVSLVLLALVAWFVAGRASAADVPAGVDTALWHPLTDRLGLALTSERGMTGQTEFVGTLMVKVGGAWHPVHLEAPGARVRPVQ